jgi:ankyrin repeat protein
MNLNEMLLDGARDGKIELVEYAIKNGADVNTGIYCMETLYTPLRLAIKNGANPKIVDLLLKHGADISRFKDMLHYLIRKEALNTLKVVLIHANTLKLDVEEKWGNYPLHFAANIGNIREAEFLINEGFNIDLKNMEGNTPLHEAVEGGYCTTVKTLLENYADYTIRNAKGKTPFEEAKDSIYGYLIPIFETHTQYIRQNLKEIDNILGEI